jgi:NitT/TauT family transport system substrate-binding protein
MVSLLFGMGAPLHAETKPLQKVRLMVATGVLDATYAEFTLPIILGYWQQEGLDVDVQPAGGSLQAFQQIVGGGADFAAGSGSAIVSANAKTNLPVRVAMTIGTSDWAIVVLDDGPIKTPKDLKGKTIGVFNLATGGLAWLNAMMRENGFDPKTDIDLVATAMGATPLQALQSGRVQGLLYWGSAVASFENSGLKLRQIYGPDWHVYPDYSLATMQAVAEKNPAMVVGMSRGIAKALTFLAANPLCALKLHWANYPSTKPTGADEETLVKNDLHSINGQLAGMTNARALFGGDKLWGRFDTAAWDRLVAFMVESKQIDEPIPAKTLPVQIADFDTRVNDFDAKAIEDSAKACKL